MKNRIDCAVSEARRALAALQLEVSPLIAHDVTRKIEELISAYREEKAVYQTTLERIANAIEIAHPFQLMMMAKNNEQTYADILVDAVKEKVRKEGK